MKDAAEGQAFQGTNGYCFRDSSSWRVFQRPIAGMPLNSWKNSNKVTPRPSFSVLFTTKMTAEGTTGPKELDAPIVRSFVNGVQQSPHNDR